MHMVPVKLPNCLCKSWVAVHVQWHAYASHVWPHTITGTGANLLTLHEAMHAHVCAVQKAPTDSTRAREIHTHCVTASHQLHVTILMV
jgi:1,4-alpha-glucan branching enzyme